MRMDDLYIRPRLRPIGNGALTGKLALVTGASRGIGAVTARALAQAGARVILNYRSKGSRAEKVAMEIEAAGGKASTIQADITVAEEADAMMEQIRREFGFFNLLILNASGGLEKDKGDDYSMQLNCVAQLNLLKRSVPLLQTRGRAVFVTSHLAHFYLGYFPGNELPEYHHYSHGTHGPRINTPPRNDAAPPPFEDSLPDVASRSFRRRGEVGRTTTRTIA
jgi:NAD(P)-dependent dehydrogenase (short-subunit alcohol dehydrogenase family)